MSGPERSMMTVSREEHTIELDGGAESDAVNLDTKPALTVSNTRVCS